MGDSHLAVDRERVEDFSATAGEAVLEALKARIGLRRRASRVGGTVRRSTCRSFFAYRQLDLSKQSAQAAIKRVQICAQILNAAREALLVAIGVFEFAAQRQNLIAQPCVLFAEISVERIVIAHVFDQPLQL